MSRLFPALLTLGAIAYGGTLLMSLLTGSFSLRNGGKVLRDEQPIMFWLMAAALGCGFVMIAAIAFGMDWEILTTPF